VHNRQLLKMIETRIAKSEQQVLAYMALHELEAFRLGRYEACKTNGYLDVQVLPFEDGFIQLTYLQKSGADATHA
jgi:hypothetical protein